MHRPLANDRLRDVAAVVVLVFVVGDGFAAPRQLWVQAHARIVVPGLFG